MYKITLNETEKDGKRGIRNEHNFRHFITLRADHPFPVTSQYLFNVKEGQRVREKDTYHGANTYYNIQL